MKHIFAQPQKLILNVTEISHNLSLKLLLRSLIITLGIFSGLTIPASADIKAGGDDTIVTPNGSTFNITGGKTIDNGKNLFHSFSEFNLTTTPTVSQGANFQPTANVQNIFGRINGGLPSSIDGKLQVTGGDPKGVNLFLMNPAGIVFGKGASLDINGAFTATTAKAIDFNGKWFNAIGDNKYTELIGNPIGFAFPGSTPGSIVSAATLSNVQLGKSITLVGGTVISTGDIKTAGGNISIATIKGGQYVKIKAEGSILSLELPTVVPTYPDNIINPAATNFTPLKLAELLTKTGVDLAATGVKKEGEVIKLIDDTRSILSGDIVTKNLNTSGNPNGGNVSLNTQAGDIIVNSIDTSSKENPDGGGNGGDVNVNAGGIFRATGFIKDTVNLTEVIDRNGKPINPNTISGVSIFTGGNRDQKQDKEDLFRGGKININYQGLFLTGGESKIDTTIDPNTGKPVENGLIVTLIGNGTSSLPDKIIANIKNGKVVFPDGTSGTEGAIVSRNSNGNLRVVFQDGKFKNGDGSDAVGFGFKGSPLTPRGDDGGVNPDQQASRPKSNSDEQASKPKSKENCTPSSTSVASNPTAAPTRSAGNPNTVSADPCQPNTSNNGILQILTDRE